MYSHHHALVGTLADCRSNSLRRGLVFMRATSWMGDTYGTGGMGWGWRHSFSLPRHLFGRTDWIDHDVAMRQDRRRACNESTSRRVHDSMATINNELGSGTEELQSVILLWWANLESSQWGSETPNNGQTKENNLAIYYNWKMDFDEIILELTDDTRWHEQQPKPVCRNQGRRLKALACGAKLWWA